MHLFRFSTPYPASGLIHCLHSSFAYSSSFCNAPRSHSYFLYFSSSAVNNPSQPSKSALPNNDESRERRASYDNRSSSRRLIQPSLLTSPFPDDTPRAIRHPIGRLDISDETTYVSPYSAIGNNERRYAKNSGYDGSEFFYVKDKNIMRSWGPNARNYDRSNTREKGLERREAQNIPQRMSFPIYFMLPQEIFSPWCLETEFVWAIRCQHRAWVLLVIFPLLAVYFSVSGGLAHLFAVFPVDQLFLNMANLIYFSS